MEQGHEGAVSYGLVADVIEDLLSITSVHPMREEAVLKLLGKSGKGSDELRLLVKQERLKVLEYEGRRFYMRALNVTSSGQTGSEVER